MIECKHYSTKNVPIGDIELFGARVIDVAELNGKAIFITKSSYSSTGYDYAKNTGLCLIEVDENDKPSILLHKKDANSVTNEIDIDIYDFIKSVLSPKKITGLKMLSKPQISTLTNNLINEIDPKAIKEFKGLTLDSLVYYFEANHGLQFESGYDLSLLYKKPLLGCFDSEKNTIHIDNFLLGTNRFSFALAHEIGHYMLHKDLKMNQQVYNSFKDSGYD